MASLATVVLKSPEPAVDDVRDVQTRNEASSDGPDQEWGIWSVGLTAIWTGDEILTVWKKTIFTVLALLAAVVGSSQAGGAPAIPSPPVDNAPPTPLPEDEAAAIAEYFRSRPPKTEKGMFREAIEPTYGVSYERYKKVNEHLGQRFDEKKAKKFSVKGLTEVGLLRDGVALEGTPAALDEATNLLAAIDEKIVARHESSGVPKTYETTAASPGADRPWYGGSPVGFYWKINSTAFAWDSYSCSSGFHYYVQPIAHPGVQWWFVSTAGHCAYSSPGIPGSGSLNKGLWTFSLANHTTSGPDCCSWGGNPANDVAVYHTYTTTAWNPGVAATRNVWMYCNNPANIPWSCGDTGNYGFPAGMTGTSVPDQHSLTCKTGQRTGTSCGSYYGVVTGVYANGQTGPVHQVNLVGQCGVFQGDSGGAVFFRNSSGGYTSAGIITGQTGVALPVSLCSLTNTRSQFSFVSNAQIAYTISGAGPANVFTW